MKNCKLCNGERFQSYGDSMGLDKNRLFMTTEGDFGEMCVVSFKVKYCPNCGKEIKNETSENRNK